MQEEQKSSLICGNCKSPLRGQQKRFCSTSCVAEDRKKNHVRRCKDCARTPEEVEFGQHPKTLDGLSIVCKPCNRLRTRKTTSNYSPERREEIKARFKSEPYKNSILLRTFGIDREYYRTLLAEQNSECAICADSFTEENFPQIDHDHSTGKVRGLLCRTCNMGLGMFKDDTDKLSQAIKYLKLTSAEDHIDKVKSLITRRKGEMRHDLKATRGILILSKEGRLRLLESQGFKCACCEDDLSHRNFLKINIDHDHAGMFIRGALCKHCNVGLGLFYENEVRFAAAIAYLVQHGASEVAA